MDMESVLSEARRAYLTSSEFNGVRSDGQTDEFFTDMPRKVTCDEIPGKTHILPTFLVKIC
ncbi:hypothetical protein DPMN_120778 [Dreissena polymorpha]|uniref:Uncharacterized protein n=1 Tax=Dreissena polymorpha TaxID=45954 RepID=A0A9D4JSG8_DREPO|nr:hypothetical protein DPMN_120777 [Dreissena polymorpha]KAH3819048.1 hypothetical protein DPMN_120778 [Dreissena polymorpha]